MGKQGSKRVILIYNLSCFRIFGPMLRDGRLTGNDDEVVVLKLSKEADLRTSFPVVESLKDLFNHLGSSEISLFLVSSCYQRYFRNYHRLGCVLSKFLGRKTGACRVVVQHGGSRLDSLDDLSTALADYFFVWGGVARKVLIRHGVRADRIFTVGNIGKVGIPRPVTSPEHAVLVGSEERGSALIAATMQREYQPQSPNGEGQYLEWFREVLSALVEGPDLEIRVRPHPYDSIEAPGAYERVLADEGLEERVEIIGPSESLECSLSRCSFVVSRASTVMEDAMMVGKSAFAVDFKGSAYLDNLQALAGFKGFRSLSIPVERSERADFRRQFCSSIQEGAGIIETEEISKGLDVCDPADRLKVFFDSLEAVIELGK
jgi:hypothetical protein